MRGVPGCRACRWNGNRLFNIIIPNPDLVAPPPPIWLKLVLWLITGQRGRGVVYRCDWCGHLIPTWWSGSHAIVDCYPFIRQLKAEGVWYVTTEEP